MKKDWYFLHDCKQQLGSGLGTNQAPYNLSFSPTLKDSQSSQWVSWQRGSLESISVPLQRVSREGTAKMRQLIGHIAANSTNRLHPSTMTTPTSQFLWLHTYLSHERRGDEERGVACQSGGGMNPHVTRHRWCRSKCIRVLIPRGSGGGLWVRLLDPTTRLRGRKRGKRHLHMLMDFLAATHQPFPVVLLSSPFLKSLAVRPHLLFHLSSEQGRQLALQLDHGVGKSSTSNSRGCTVDCMQSLLLLPQLLHQPHLFLLMTHNLCRTIASIGCTNITLILTILPPSLLAKVKT